MAGNMRRLLLIFSAVLMPNCAANLAAQNSSLLHAPQVRNPVPGQMGLTQPLSPPVQGVMPGQGVTARGFPATTVSQRVDGQLVQYGPPNEGGEAPFNQPPAMRAQPPVQGQGPLLGVDANGRPRVTIAEASWTYQPPPPMRVFRQNDLITVRVDEITRVMAEGSSENRKRTLYEAILTDWINLAGFKLRPDPQLEGDPTVAAESNSNFRAEATVESRESLTFNIAASVVDIRPNGMLVIEGTKSIRVNDNLWETSISGLCRAQDVGPDNVVLSKDMIGVEIKKQDRGHLRDGYKRGWFQRAFDRVQPF